MTKKKISIIAEAGVNHNGSLFIAKKLIDIAASSGADFVKFQHTNPNLVSSKAPLCNYQKKDSLKNQKDMVKKFHINWDKAYPILINYCKKKKIKFIQSFFSAQDYKSARKYNFSFIKIASSDIINEPLLKIVGKDNKKIFLSTGMASIHEVKKAVNILVKSGTRKNKITLFHCISSYPAPLESLNLNSILFLKKHTKLNVGFSDHSEGSFASGIALSMGCKIIEKHFTLSKKMKGPDHKLSLNPEELKNFVFKMKNYYKILGKKRKICEKIESENKFATRQSVHASKDIKKGEIITQQNIMLKRPSAGIPPSGFERLLGTRSKKFFKFDDPVN